MSRRRLLFLIVFLLAGLPHSGRALEIHSFHCLYGCPKGATEARDLVVRQIYLLSANNETRLADWVAYRVTAATIGSQTTRNWRRDPWLAPDETLSPADYEGAHAALGVDRGHQAPLASFAGTSDWAETNYLSNITPQASALNQGPWARLENAVRALAREPTVEAVYVMTGPLFEAPMAALPKAARPHRVPSGYWKVVALPAGGTVLAAGFVLPQTAARGDDHCHYQASLPAIERASGLGFFHGLDAAPQVAVQDGAAALLARLGCAPAPSG